MANFYVNVGGHIKKNFTVDVSELSEDASEEALMACSCATGSPFGQAAVLGVPLASIVEMADLEEGVNTVTAYGARPGSASLCRCATLWSMMRCSSTR